MTRYMANINWRAWYYSYLCARLEIRILPTYSILLVNTERKASNGKIMRTFSKFLAYILDPRTWDI